MGGGGVVAGGGRCRWLIRHLGTRAEISGIRAAQLTTDVHRVVLQTNSQNRIAHSPRSTVLPLNTTRRASSITISNEILAIRLRVRPAKLVPDETKNDFL